MKKLIFVSFSKQIPSTFVLLKNKTMEYNIVLSNRQVLKGMISTPGDKAKAFIIFVHGLGEHIQRYESWAALLNREGIGFTGVDLPGHGRSDGARGNIRSYSLTDEMIEILQENVSKTFPGIPVFIYGQSLGGGIVLDFLLRKKPGFKGAIVTSPWLKLSFQPGKSKIMLAAMMKNILPGMVQPSGLVVDHFSHDREVVKRYTLDPLVHNKISVSLFHSAMSAAGYALAHASELNIPLLLMHGSDDLLCSPDGSREFASKTKLAELKIWEGGYHELHNELFRDKVFEYLKTWINKMVN
ncbi:MAG: lysophospholipase [Bacteroidia bacterium]|nr:lysophospholipase [Bacteroidia bacterium]